MQSRARARRAAPRTPADPAGSLMASVAPACKKPWRPRLLMRRWLQSGGRASCPSWSASWSAHRSRTWPRGARPPRCRQHAPVSCSATRCYTELAQHNVRAYATLSSSVSSTCGHTIPCALPGQAHTFIIVIWQLPTAMASCRIIKSAAGCPTQPPCSSP